MHNSIFSVENYFEIAAGRIQRFTALQINGRNPDVGAAEDIWNYGTVQTLMTVPAEIFVSSSAAANDDDQIIVIDGLDENWDIQQVQVTPNNQAAVIVPQGNNTDTYMLSFAALVAGPPAGTIITQAVTGASMTVVDSDTTHNTITGYLIGTADLVNGFVDPTATMNPDPNVPTAIDACALWIRINRAYNISANALNGDLYIAEHDTLAVGVPTTATLVHSKIDIGMEETQNAHYSVPRWHNAYMMDGWASINNDKGYAHIAVDIRDFGGLFRNRLFTSVTNDGSSYLQRTQQLPALIAGKSDIKITCPAVEAVASDVSAGFEMILENTRAI